jgi:hypothetical protein
MPDLTIRQGLWDDLVVVAEKQHKRPQTLAQQVIQEYVQRMSDEELLERSATAARRAPFRMDETEGVIRDYRRKKRA